MEPNPGQDDNTPPHGMVHTLAENFERCASEQHDQHEDQQPRNSKEKSPETQGAKPVRPPGDDTEQATPHEVAAPRPPNPHNTEGFRYSPPSPQEDTQPCSFPQDSENPFDKPPIHTPTEYQLIDEVVKLNTGTPQQPMIPGEQETLKTSVI